MSIKQNKKVLPYIVVNFTLKESNFFIFRDEFNNELEEEVSQSIQTVRKTTSILSKKRNNRVLKEVELDKTEATIRFYVIKLNDKYICSIRNHKLCFIKEDYHLA